jgi:hypothetical protein
MSCIPSTETVTLDPAVRGAVVRVDFNRPPMPQLCGTVFVSDAGSLAYRELCDALFHGREAAVLNAAAS